MSKKNNPLINGSSLKFKAVPFDDIKIEHFLPAIEHAINKAEQALEQIINNPDNPTFENTFLQMENGTELMEDVANAYFNLMGAESDNKFKELAQQISPKLSDFSNKVLLNSLLFERVKYIYDNRKQNTKSRR